MGILLISSVILFFMVGDFFLFGVNVWVRLCIIGNVFGVFGLGFFVEFIGLGLLLFVSSILFMVDFKLIVFLCVFLFLINIMSFFWLFDWKRFFFEF